MRHRRGTRVAGTKAIIGASCYDDVALAEAAVAAGADYVAFGAVLPTRPAKTGTRHADPRLLGEAASAGRAAGGDRRITWTMPVHGGAGADLVAVISGVYDAVDPVAAISAYRRSFL